MTPLRLAALFALCCGCAAAPPQKTHSEPVTAGEPAPTKTSVAKPDAGPAGPELYPSTPSATAFDGMVAAALMRVSRARELPILAEVRGELVDRAKALILLRENVDRNMPPKALEAQGELLRAMGLIPADYPFVERLYSFANAEITGLYDPHRKAMFVLADVPAVAAENALFHELAHALHDQHFDLAARLKYQPGQSDRVAAQHSMAEGDATSTAFLVQFDRVPDAEGMRRQMLDQLSEQTNVPKTVREALVTPYTDGLAFVEALRKDGGFKAVDAAWRRPPRSTEQLLHVDKYRADEAPLIVSLPVSPAPGWQLDDDDVIGEQGMRMMFAQWGSDTDARRAAAGWGGDHYALYVQPDQGTARDIWIAHSIRFDTVADAVEAERFISARHPRPCNLRPTVGPLSYKRQASRLVLAAGPYRLDRGRAQPIAGASCSNARKWIDQILLAARRADVSASAAKPSTASAPKPSR